MTATHFSIESGTPVSPSVIVRTGPVAALRHRPTPTETSYAALETHGETRTVVQLFSRALLRNTRTDFDETIEKIYDLIQPTDARDFPAHPLAADNAAQWLEELHNDIAALGITWHEPKVSSEPEGNIVFEWRQGARRLVVYVAPHAVEFVKAWGPSMIHQMEDGLVVSPHDRQALWLWLRDENP